MSERNMQRKSINTGTSYGQLVPDRIGLATSNDMDMEQRKTLEQSQAACTASTRPVADAYWFGLLVRKIFHAGFQRAAVDRRWDAFQRAFHGFQPQQVAAFTHEDIERLCVDSALIRNRRKLAAVVSNARRVVQLAETHGSFGAWLDTLIDAPYECRVEAMVAVFEQMGERTAFWFLFEAGLARLDEGPTTDRAVE